MLKKLYLFDSWTEVAFGTVVLAVLYAVSLSNYLLFHSLAELFSVVVGFAAFVLVAGAQQRIQTGFVLILGCSFLFISSIDLLHTLAYKGMGVFPGDDPNLPTQFWILARYGEALAFLGATVFWRARVRFELLFWITMAACGVGIALVLSGVFPDCYVEGQGLTPFKIISEYVICTLMLAAGVLLWRVRGALGSVELRMISVALAAGIVAELAFTFYVSVYGLSNLVGHYFKIFSFYFIYKAIVETGYSRPQELLFRQLAVSEANLRQSQRLMRMGSWEHTYEDGRMHWSAHMYDLLGLDPDTEEEPSLDLLMSAVRLDDRPDVRQALNRARDGREPVEIEFRNGTTSRGTSDAAHHFRLVAQTEVDAAGAPLRLYGALIDVTARVQARRLREEVERITRHDLKTPLHSIIYLTQFLEDTDLDDEQAEYVGDMRRVSYQMLSMINQSLVLYRMEHGEFTLEPAAVNLPDVLDRVERDLSELAAGARQELDIRIDGRPMDGKEGFQVQGDELLLYTLFANLVRNALEAAPRGATVRVDCISEGGERLVAVHNPGVVPEAVRNRFFDKDVTYGKKHGTGLGTYSARLIAEVHDGTIWFSSSEAEGTTVRVQLPA